MGWKNLITLLLSFWITSCMLVANNATTLSDSNTKRSGYDVKLFKGPAYHLAQAVLKEQPVRIHQILKSKPTLVNYQESHFGKTLLEFAAQSNLSISVKALLEAGANPNIANNYNGYTPLMAAARHTSLTDSSTESIRLLLRYGANPNAVSRPVAPSQRPTTALILAASNKLEYVRILVNAGADIDITIGTSKDALERALALNRIDVARYLIVEKHADVMKNYTVTLSGDTLKINDLLKRLTFHLESDNYKKKMEIVRYLESLGIDYRNAKVPLHFYKIYSKDYLMKY